MRKQIWIAMILCITGCSIAHAQLKISAVAGGGISDMHTGFPFSDNSSELLHLVPGPLMQVGTSVSSTFREGGMLSWETQLLLRRSTLRSVPIDYDKADCTPLGGMTVCQSPFPRDFGNVYRWNNWAVNVPVSLNFQVFGPVGWKVGGNAHFVLSEFPEEDKNHVQDGEFESINWQGHIGFFARLGSNMRLEALGYSDLLPRLRYERLPTGRPLFSEYREMGLYLNLIYNIF